jgi:hypothetical protein
VSNGENDIEVTYQALDVVSITSLQQALRESSSAPWVFPVLHQIPCPREDDWSRRMGDCSPLGSVECQPPTEHGQQFPEFELQGGVDPGNRLPPGSSLGPVPPSPAYRNENQLHEV